MWRRGCICRSVMLSEEHWGRLAYTTMQTCSALVYRHSCIVFALAWFYHRISLPPAAEMESGHSSLSFSLSLSLYHEPFKCCMCVTWQVYGLRCVWYYKWICSQDIMDRYSMMMHSYQNNQRNGYLICFFTWGLVAANAISYSVVWLNSDSFPTQVVAILHHTVQSCNHGFRKDFVRSCVSSLGEWICFGVVTAAVSQRLLSFGAKDAA